jgi:uncharacterized protein YfaT (DUF1175 family)
VVHVDEVERLLVHRLEQLVQPAAKEAVERGEPLHGGLVIGKECVTLVCWNAEGIDEHHSSRRRSVSGLVQHRHAPTLPLKAHPVQFGKRYKVPATDF